MDFPRRCILVSSVILSDILICHSNPTVYTKIGVVVGTETYTRLGRPVNAYLGIPYAIPPLGELRFQDPVPIQRYENTIYATKEVSKCVQRGNMALSEPLRVVGNEDCLYCHIYTPRFEKSYETKNLPVMFYIHGGGFVTGSSDRLLYGPEYLLDVDIVYVACNYRLDVFGFFSSGDALAPGNFGLKDQATALKWVSENIKSFGGDPNDITIFGESVGGVSVNSLMASNLAKGLFRRVISISGTVDMPVAHFPVEEVAGSTRQLAELAGCPTAPSKDLLECMRTVPAYELITNQVHLHPEGFPPFLIMSWVPVYDYYITRDAYFYSDPKEATRETKYPWISGFVLFDGTYFVTHIYSYPEFKDRLKANPEKYIPQLMYLPSYLPSEAVPYVTKRLVDHYFGTRGVNQETLLEIFTDAFFCIPALRTALAHGGPTWFYKYTYPLPQTWNYIYGPPGVVNERPGHSDILLNLFESSELFNRTYDETDIQVSEGLVDIFTNFAITGNPSIPGVEWDTIYGTDHSFNYIQFGKDFVQLQNDPCSGNSQFWRSLEEEFPTLY